MRQNQLLQPHYDLGTRPITRVVEPVLKLRELVATGYDAIVQMTGTPMASALRRELGNRDREAKVSVTTLSAAGREIVNAMVASERAEAPIVALSRRAGEMIEVDLEPWHIVAWISVVGVRIESGIDPTCSVRIRARLQVIAGESAAGHAERVDQSSFLNLPPRLANRLPVDARRYEHRPVDLEVFEFNVNGPIVANIDRTRYRIDALMNFGDVEFVRSSPRTDFTEDASDICESLLRGWGAVRVAPTVQLFGDPPHLPVHGVDRFDLTLVGGNGNQSGDTVLSFCLETVGGTSAPDASRVGAFTGSRNTAAFATESIVTATVRSRWRSIPKRSVVRTVELHELDNDGNLEQRGTAQVHYAVGDSADSAVLALGPSGASESERIPDHVHVRATFESRAESARLGSNDITTELGELADVRQSTESFLMFLDDLPVAQVDPDVDDWLLGIGRHVLQPLLRPFTHRWRLANYEAQVSAALSATLTRGNLQ